MSDGLRDTGRAGRPNHFFLPSSEKHFRPKYGFDAKSDFADYVRGVVKKTPTSNEVFAFKLMAWYLPKFLARLRQTGAFGEPDDSDLKMLRAAFPRLRFIRISRRGKLRQAISKVRATQTGVWKVQESETKIAEPEFDRALIDRSRILSGSRCAKVSNSAAGHSPAKRQHVGRMGAALPRGRVAALSRFAPGLSARRCGS